MTWNSEADKFLRCHLEIYLICALLMAAVLVAYWNAPYNGFAYDDYGYILANKPIQLGLSLSGLTWAFTTFYSGNWHPLTWVSHMIDCGLYAAKPVGHHLTSTVLHLANTLLLFALLMRATGAAWRSAFVALLFAVHPLHVESVAWISERKDVLSTFFGLLAMLSYVAYTRSPSRWRYGLVLLLFLLGLMSKPMLVTLPILLILTDYWPLGRMGPGKRSTASLAWEKAPLFVISAASAAVTIVAQRLGASIPSLTQLPLGYRLSNAVVSYVVYIRKMFWPSDLVAFYPHPEGGLAWWKISGAAALLAVATVLVLRRRTPRYVLVGWLWYLTTLVPVIGIVQVGGQAMADRYTYVPLIGLFIVVAWGVPDLICALSLSNGRGRQGATVLTVLAVLVTLPLILTTRRQVSYWENDETLFTHAVKLTHRNWVANHTLGVTFANRREWRRALRYAQEAVHIQPYNPTSRLLLANVLLHLDRLDEAVDQLDEAVILEPDSAETHAQLANALRLQGYLAEAREEAEIALELQPDNATARAVLDKLGSSQMRR